MGEGRPEQKAEMASRIAHTDLSEQTGVGGWGGCNKALKSKACHPEDAFLSKILLPKDSVTFPNSMSIQGPSVCTHESSGDISPSDYHMWGWREGVPPVVGLEIALTSGHQC